MTTPLDVVKTRLMIQVLIFHSNLSESRWMLADDTSFLLDLFYQGSGNQYKGVFDCVQTVVREEGPAALLKVWPQKINEDIVKNEKVKNPDH